MKTPLPQRLSWTSYYWLGNIIVWLLIGLRYLQYGHPVASPLGVLFLSLQFIGQFGAIIILFGLIPSTLFALIVRHRLSLTIFSVILSSFFALFLFIDTSVYALYHHHINGLLLEMVFSSAFSSIFELSSIEWALFMGMVLITFALMIAWAKWLWRSKKKRSLRTSIISIIVVLMCFASSHFVHAYADAFGDSAVLTNSEILPYYYGLTARRFFIRHHWTTAAKINENAAEKINIKNNNVMQYPLHPLKVTHKKSQALNVLIIGIDTWRHDMMTQKITPNIYRYALKNIIFKHHYSGGNCTQPGIFSLFYGIPSNYWQVTYDHKIAPLMLKELKKQHYHLGIFMSAPLVQPPFYRNVFTNVDHLIMNTPGSSAWQTDENITQETISFLKKNQHRHFFAFMFYNALHDFSFPPNSPTPFKPWWKNINHLALNNNFDPTPYLNRYKNAAYFDDQQIQKILMMVKQLKLSRNTVVILTSDHGQEFNENHKNYWGHGSNFTPYQTWVPFIVHWPGMKPHNILYQTSHFDVAPTILETIAGVQNPASDYSVGHSLFKNAPEPFYVEGSYTSNAIITRDKITTIYMGGYTNTTDIHLNPVKQGISPRILLKATQQMSRYYK